MTRSPSPGVLVLATTFPLVATILLADQPATADPADLAVRQALADRGPVAALAIQSPTWQDLGPATARLVLDLGDGPRRAVVRPAAVRAPGFRVRIQDASGDLRAVPTPPPSVWVGQLIDRPDSRVLVRRADGQLSGSVSLGSGEVWQLAPVGTLPGHAGDGRHVAYRLAAGAATAGTCALGGPAISPSGPIPERLDKSASLTVRICELACDADVEFFELNGSSVDATVADIELVIAGVSTVYALDLRLAYQITEVIVRTAEPDPYDQTVPMVLLQQFTDHWQDHHGDVPRDLAHLFTGKDLAGTPVGIAWQGTGVCSVYNGYSLVQSRFSSELAERIAVSAHELGHNYDAVHCDYGGSWWCRIMCAAIGGCSGGVQSFGPLAIEDIGAEADAVGCLEPGTVLVPTADLPFYDDFQDWGEIDPARWVAADQAAVIYGRLELESGETWGVNELGTIRTLPMDLTGAARLSFRCRSYGLPAGQPLRIETFDSATWTWDLLETILATGGSSNPWVDHAIDIPAEAAGPFFAVRFSADGNQGDSSDEWHLDDVAIDPLTTPAPQGLPAASPLAVSLAPNPFNPRTTITVHVPTGGPVRVVARDAAGRRVATIHDAILDTGEHRIAWQGRDDAGRPLASGTYLLDVVAASQRAAIKAVLLR
jgi:hypothetical protein